MKILYLHQYFNTPDMPGGTRSYEMARRLVNAGHDVDLVTSERSSNGSIRRRSRVEDIEGIRVHWLPVPYSNHMSYSRRLLAFVQFAFAATRRASALPVDLVFATSTPLTIALPAVFTARRQAIPMVLEVRDLWPEVPIALGALTNPITKKTARALERFAYRNSAKVVALSPGMREGVIKTGYPADRVSVIPNSSDLDLFDVGSGPGRRLRARYDWLGDRPLILYMGALGTMNGVDYLARVAAAARAHHAGLRFVVVGDGREEPRIRRLAHELGVLDDNFFMLGPIPKRETPAWLSAADVATSLVLDFEATRANSANKFFDALAARTPIAINYGGWQADLLRESGAGLVLEPQEPAEAARHLAGAVRDADWLRRASNAAGELAEHRFSRDRLAVELENVLRLAVGENPR